jgi:hypothetical protein
MPGLHYDLQWSLTLACWTEDKIYKYILWQLLCCIHDKCTVKSDCSKNFSSPEYVVGPDKIHGEILFKSVPTAGRINSSCNKTRLNWSELLLIGNSAVSVPMCCFLSCGHFFHLTFIMHKHTHILYLYLPILILKRRHVTLYLSIAFKYTVNSSSFIKLHVTNDFQ